MFRCKFCNKTYKNKRDSKRHIEKSKCRDRYAKHLEDGMIEALPALSVKEIHEEFRWYRCSTVPEFAENVMKGCVRNKILMLGNQDNPVIVFKTEEGKVVRGNGMTKLLKLLAGHLQTANPDAFHRVFIQK